MHFLYDSKRIQFELICLCIIYLADIIGMMIAPAKILTNFVITFVIIFYMMKIAERCIRIECEK